MGAIFTYMVTFKRDFPRIAVESLGAEVDEAHDRLGFVVDLSSDGLRIEHAHLGRRESRIVQLEFELPCADDVIWASGEVRFDHYRWTPRGAVRSTGIRLIAAASKHLRLLRDWVEAQAQDMARAQALTAR